MSKSQFTPELIKKGRALDHLMALLKVEGLSGQEKNIAAEVRQRLLDVGCKNSWIKFDKAHQRIGRGYQVGNLILQLPGKGALRSEPCRLFSGHLDTVELLIATGADMNTALIPAVIKGNTEIVQMLLHAGADVHTQNNTYMTALMFAARKDYTDIAVLLLDAGADVKARDKDGKSALMYAKENGHTEVVKLLREAGAKE